MSMFHKLRIDIFNNLTRLLMKIEIKIETHELIYTYIHREKYIYREDMYRWNEYNPPEGEYGEIIFASWKL